MSSRAIYDEFFDAERLQKLRLRYNGYSVLPVSKGSVRDYCDSADHLGPLAHHQLDLKDIQRCWLLKAVLSSCHPGAKLLEVGAGEPVVAGLLSRLGYDVTVIDPYDGNGNGPTDFERFQAEYADIVFRREYVTPAIELSGKPFDLVYSISVLEHVPLDKLAGVFDGIKQLLRVGGLNIHAVDHVLAGAGSDYHVQLLAKIANRCTIPMSELWQTLDAAKTDPDTYFLSAEAHNRWRGSIPYDQFPMRRCISVQFKGALT